MSFEGSGGHETPGFISRKIMGETTRKFENFTNAPIGNKMATDLPGIGPVLGARLSEKGYERADLVLGMYLICRKNDEFFMEWLHETCGANRNQASNCAKALKEWCSQFL